MSRVFLSYVREDAKRVDRLKRDLEQRGVEVWIDRDAIDAGERWQPAVRRGIADGAAFLACLSRAFAARKESVMYEELREAIGVLRRLPPNPHWYVSVLLDPGVEVPDFEVSPVEHLRDYQWVDLSTDWEGGLERLLRLVAAPEAADQREARVRGRQPPVLRTPPRALPPKEPGEAWHLPPRRRTLQRPHGPRVTALATDPRDRWIATGGADGVVRLWPAPRLEGVVPLEHGAHVSDLRFSGDGAWLVAASAHDGVHLWDTEHLSEPAALDLEGLLQPDTEPVLRAAFSRAGDLLGVSNLNGGVVVCETAGGRHLEGVPALKFVRTIAFGPYNRLLAAGSIDGKVRLIDVDSGEDRLPDASIGDFLDRSVEELRFSADGAVLVARSERGTLRAWDVESGAEEHQLRRDGIVTVAFGPSPTALAAAGSDGTAWLADVDTGESIAGPFHHGGTIEHIVVSPDGRLLVTVGVTARVWDLESGLERPPPDHPAVRRAAFTARGDVLVTAGLPRLPDSIVHDVGDDLRLWPASPS